MASNAIRFWIQPRMDKQWLLQRLGWLILGSDDYQAKDSGYQYTLGRSNDWWVSFDSPKPEGTLVILAYRYASGEKMAALRTVILWLLGLEYINQKMEERIASDQR